MLGTCGPRRICQVRLWKWASVSIGAPFCGKRGDAPFLGLSREGRSLFFIRRIFIEEFERNVK
jgi:hypothetical protein